MAMMAEILIYVYAFLMIAAAISARMKMANWLFYMNLISAVLLLFIRLSPVFLLCGLLAIMVAAMLNGQLLNGRIRISHLLVRGIVSGLLYVLYLLFR